MNTLMHARARARAHTHTHTHTHTKWTNGQMLSPPRLSTSTLRSVAEIAPLPLETWPPCATWSLGASTTIHLELGQSHSEALTVAQLWDWTPRPTSTRLLHDVAAKPEVMSTPVNDQVLIYTPESREASVGEFLAQGNCNSVASTRIKPSALITKYKIADVITNAPSQTHARAHAHPNRPYLSNAHLLSAM